MRRLEQVNDLLRSELAKLISEEIKLEGGLITISRVACSTDLKRAKVYITVLPENFSGTALSKLKRASGFFSNALKKKLTMKFIPRLYWLIDEIERNANEIDDILEQIKREK